MFVQTRLSPVPSHNSASPPQLSGHFSVIFTFVCRSYLSYLPSSRLPVIIIRSMAEWQFFEHFGKTNYPSSDTGSAGKGFTHIKYLLP